MMPILGMDRIELEREYHAQQILNLKTAVNELDIHPAFAAIFKKIVIEIEYTQKRLDLFLPRGEL